MVQHMHWCHLCDTLVQVLISLNMFLSPMMRSNWRPREAGLSMYLLQIHHHEDNFKKCSYECMWQYLYFAHLYSSSVQTATAPTIHATLNATSFCLIPASIFKRWSRKPNGNLCHHRPSIIKCNNLLSPPTHKTINQVAPLPAKINHLVSPSSNICFLLLPPQPP